MRPVIGFVGMTHLGLVSGVAAADKGFQVVCFDSHALHIAALTRAVLPISEPDLAKLVARNSSRLRFTSNPAELNTCDLVYVAQDVSTDGNGKSDLAPLNAMLDQAFASTRDDAVLVVLSQVPPGFTRMRQRPGRYLYYQVETLIFGKAVERALNPERYIVGCADPSRPLPPGYSSFLVAHDCAILPMRYESAELAKISINMCLVASVSVANTVAELCERIGADWSEIMPALKLDKRIGPYSYLSPGLGISGGNLERDLATFCALAESNGTDAGIVHAWLANSTHRRDWPLRVLQQEVLSKLENATIAILGLAYKQDTHSTKNSPAVALLDQLQNYRVRVFDPLVRADVVAHPRLHAAESELETCEGADAVAIMTPWQQFAKLQPAEIARQMSGNLVVDPYGMLDSHACRKAGLRHVRLGAAV